MRDVGSLALSLFELVSGSEAAKVQGSRSSLDTPLAAKSSSRGPAAFGLQNDSFFALNYAFAIVHLTNTPSSTDSFTLFCLSTNTAIAPFQIKSALFQAASRQQKSQQSSINVNVNVNVSFSFSQVSIRLASLNQLTLLLSLSPTSPASIPHLASGL